MTEYAPMDQPVGMALVIIGLLTIPALFLFFWVQGKLAEGRGVLLWNADKPHRCPDCHASTVTVEDFCWWKVYNCCMCGVYISRFPRISGFLKPAGTACASHSSRHIHPVGGRHQLRKGTKC